MVCQEGGPIKRPSVEPAYRRAAARIQQMIETGELQPGDQLLPERKLAELLNVSRTAIREALQALSGSGFVDLTGQGAVVRRPRLEEVSGAFASIVQAEARDVLELLETRAIIEGRAARLAAWRREEGDLYRLAACAEEVEAAVRSGADAADPDTNFHLGLVDCAKNGVLSRVFRMLDDAMRRTYGPARSRMLADPAQARAFLDEHWRLIDALRARRQEEAARVAEEHIARAVRLLRGAE